MRARLNNRRPNRKNIEQIDAVMPNSIYNTIQDPLVLYQQSVRARHCTADSDRGLPLRVRRRGMTRIKPSELYGVRRRYRGSKRGRRYRKEA